MSVFCQKSSRASGFARLFCVLFITLCLGGGVFVGGAYAQASPESHPPPHNAGTLDRLFYELQKENTPNPRALERAIWQEWSRSGERLPDLMLQNGQRAMRQRAYDAAIAQFTALIDTNPAFAEAWNMRATTYYLMGDFPRSIADVRQVLLREPRHFGALVGLGAMLLQLGKKVQALEAYKAALAVNPHQLGAKDVIEQLEKAILRESL